MLCKGPGDGARQVAAGPPSELVVEHAGHEVHEADDGPTGLAAALSADVLARKYGPDAVPRITNRLDHLGRQEGLDYRWDRVQRVNSFDAHRLLAWAATHGTAAQNGEPFAACSPRSAPPCWPSSCGCPRSC